MAHEARVKPVSVIEQNSATLKSSATMSSHLSTLSLFAMIAIVFEYLLQRYDIFFRLSTFLQKNYLIYHIMSISLRHFGLLWTVQ